MDPRVFRVEKHGSARFSGRTWIRTFFGPKNMDPRVFRYRSGVILGSFRGHSGIILDHSGVIPGTFRSHSGVIPASLQGRSGAMPI